MTLAAFQPHVEAALVAHEWAAARARWRGDLESQQASLRKALSMSGSYGIEPEPLEARLRQIDEELNGDITPDQVPQHPLRSVPMDLVTEAVVRRLLRIPASFPVLSIKTLPSEHDLRDAVAAIAARWSTPNGALSEEQAQIA